MGVFTLFLTNSAHVAPIPGGVRPHDDYHPSYATQTHSYSFSGNM